MVKPVPDGYHTVTPYLSVRGAGKLLDFLLRALDATETECLKLPDGSVKHAEVQIGDSRVMIGETPSDWEPMPSMLYLYVPDMEPLFRRAVEAGGEVVEEPTDHFYGDRSGAVRDPCGNLWYLSTHIEDMTPEELERRAAAAMSGDSGP